MTRSSKYAQQLAFTFLCLITIVALAGATAVAQTTVTKSVSNGAEGDIDFGCMSDCYCVQFFEVAQTSSGVTLSFLISTPDNQGLVGIGVIPSADFSVSPKQLVLSTDTAADATMTGFTNLVCDFSGNCAPAAGGTISFTWQQAGNVSFSFTGINKLMTPFFSLLQNGSRSGNSAGVSGSFSLSANSITYSSTIAPGVLTGEIVSNRNVQITITH